MQFKQQFRSYVTLDNFSETYEMQHPSLSIHNLVVGKIYIDLGETGTIINLQRPNE